MAIEDAAALGILFSQAYLSGDVAESLQVYQEVRLPRATKVQAASAKAAYNINERIGEWTRLATLSDERADLLQVFPATPIRPHTRWRMRSRN